MATVPITSVNTLPSVPVTLPSVALPPQIVYDILRTGNIRFSEYISLANWLLPIFLPLDSYENGRLLCQALLENSYDKVKFLLDLGVPIVNVEKKCLITMFAVPSVLSPEFVVSQELAELYAEAILKMSGNALDILQKEIRSTAQRLNMFKPITDSQLLARLYIHVNKIAMFPQTDVTLILCGRAGLFTEKDKSRIQVLIALMDTQPPAVAFPSDLSEQLSEAQAQFSERLSEVQAELASVKTQVFNKESEIQRLNSRHYNDTTGMSTEMDRIISENESLEETNRSLEETNESLKETNETLTEEIAKLNSSNSDLRMKLSATEKTLTSFNTQNLDHASSARREITALEAELSIAKKVFLDLSKIIK